MIEAAKILSLPVERACIKCGEIKPLSEFYKCKRGRLGLHSHCKECERERRRKRTREEQNAKYGKEEADKRRLFNRKKKEALEGYKFCTRCERTKKVSAFQKGSKETKLGLASYCRSCMAQWAKKRSASSPVNRLKVGLNTAKGAARRKGLSFSLSTEDLMSMWEAQDGRCFYTGVRMSYAGDRLQESVSLDRVDSSKGYVPKNVVLCCNVVNLMKRDMPISELTRWCELILDGMKEVRHR
jgi:hypothetical protein